MPNSPTDSTKAGPTGAIVLAFACVYFFWGSTYTAIRIGSAWMPALLFSGLRFFIAGLILLSWCAWRRLPLFHPPRTMAILGVVGVLLLGFGNVGLVYAERVVPSGLSSLVLAITPLFVALLEMALPGGEPLPLRGWLGMALGVAGLAALLSPTLRTGLAGDSARLGAIAVLMGGGFCWAMGSLLSRRSRLPVNTFVAAAWQMILAGLACLVIGSLLGTWNQAHANRAVIGSLAYLITCGSLIGYTCFIYLLEHVPVSKVASYAYVNPVVAVLLGIFFLGERPEPAEFAGMAMVILAVFLLNTARISARPRPVEDLEQLPEE